MNLYTLVYLLFFFKSQIKNLQIIYPNDYFIILKYIIGLNHEIKIGRPTVAVVINAPAKIIKGR